MNDIMFSVLIQAPYTPFLTELMYQNLKTLIDPVSVQDKDTFSIHYLMPEVDFSLQFGVLRG